MISSLPQHENEHQQSITYFWSCTLVNRGIAQIFEHITELLNIFIAKRTRYQTKNTDDKIIDIPNCKTCKNRVLDVEYMIVVRYCSQNAKARALYKFTDGSAGQLADNRVNSDRFREYNRTVPKLMVRMYGRP